MKASRATAPTRIDLAGGTLDIWPLYLLFPGSLTLNLAIRRPARAEVRPRKDGAVVLSAAEQGETVRAASLRELAPAGPLPLHREIVRARAPRGGFSLVTRASVPRGSGLGGSSSLAVAALHALALAAGRPLGRSRIVTLARDLEAAVLGIPTGTQDHFAAAYGGLAALHLEPGGPRREALPTDPRALVRHLVLAVAGGSRPSADTNWRLVKAALDGEGEARERFREIAAAAREMRRALLGGALMDIGCAMERDHEARTGLSSGVETPGMRRLARAARDAGALALKVCGAGGGGGMLFLAPAGGKGRISRAVAAAGGRVLSFGPDAEGLVP